jgi:hypothetical protein
MMLTGCGDTATLAVSRRPPDGKAPGLCVRIAQRGRPCLGAGKGSVVDRVNERDEIGSDLVPDYMTAVRTEASPVGRNSNYGQQRRARRAERPDLVVRAITPEAGLNGAASLAAFVKPSH